jgi:hypothetical protein
MRQLGFHNQVTNMLKDFVKVVTGWADDVFDEQNQNSENKIWKQKKEV